MNRSELKGVSYMAALEKALVLEEQIMIFHALAAEVLGSFMADVPKAFQKKVKKRGERIETFQSLLDRLDQRSNFQ